MLEKLKEQARQFYIRLNQRTSGWLAMLARAFSRFSEKGSTETAAAISFYAIFSIFPLLVFLVIATRSLITQPLFYELVRSFLATSSPVSLEPLLQEVDTVIQSYESLNLIALIGFLWAASSVFSAYMFAVNVAWGRNDFQSALKSRIVALILVTCLAVVLILTIIIITLFRILAAFLLPSSQQFLVVLVTSTIQTLILYILLRWGPSNQKDINSKATLIAAITTVIALEITTRGFTWYLQSGWSNYTAFYGSLGAIIGLLFWVYISSMILLLGAYLAEAIDFRLQHGPNMDLPDIFPTAAK
jgi:membrane protein